MIPPTEADNDFDGVLSHAGEWHALVIGIGVGVATVVPSARLKAFVYTGIGLGDCPRSTAMREVAAESWYAMAGVVVGMLATLAIVLTLAYLGAGIL